MNHCDQFWPILDQLRPILTNIDPFWPNQPILINSELFIMTHFDPFWPIPNFSLQINWRVKGIRTPKVLKGHDDHVITCLQFSNNRIVSGSDDNTLKVSIVKSKLFSQITHLQILNCLLIDFLQFRNWTLTLLNKFWIVLF